MSYTVRYYLNDDSIMPDLVSHEEAPNMYTCLIQLSAEKASLLRRCLRLEITEKLYTEG